MSPRAGLGPCPRHWLSSIWFVGSRSVSVRLLVSVRSLFPDCCGSYMCGCRLTVTDVLRCRVEVVTAGQCETVHVHRPALVGHQVWWARSCPGSGLLGASRRCPGGDFDESSFQLRPEEGEAAGETGGAAPEAEHAGHRRGEQAGGPGHIQAQLPGPSDQCCLVRGPQYPVVSTGPSCDRHLTDQCF